MTAISTNGYRITIHGKLSPSPATARALDALLDGDGRSGLAGKPGNGNDGAAAGHPATLLVPASPERPVPVPSVAGG